MAVISKEQLLDTSRYQFEKDTVPVPELGWGEDAEVEVKTLSVEERDALPDLTDADGKPEATVENLAEVWATVVSEPKVSADEAKKFLGKLPATTLDKVIVKFGKLLQTEDEDEAEGKEKAESDATSSET